jgi:hypothetical protein
MYLNISAIDAYTKYTIGFIQELIEQTVPWGKPSKHSQPWWTEEVQEAVREERKARRRLNQEIQEEASLRKNYQYTRENEGTSRRCSMSRLGAEGSGNWQSGERQATDQSSCQ